MTALLAIHDLRVACGQADIVRGIFSRIEAVQIVTVSGPSSGGKTTPLVAAMGLPPARWKQICDNIERHDSRVAATYLGGHA